MHDGMLRIPFVSAQLTPFFVGGRSLEWIMCGLQTATRGVHRKAKSRESPTGCCCDCRRCPPGDGWVCPVTRVPAVGWDRSGDYRGHRFSRAGHHRSSRRLANSTAVRSSNRLGTLIKRREPVLFGHGKRRRHWDNRVHRSALCADRPAAFYLHAADRKRSRSGPGFRESRV